ncbi:MAG: hypothetical protein K1X51_00100 [Rhodospirillaceae bacterium]|nr:hypothetical protein [Rhodospirillaceae bacterium]
MTCQTIHRAALHSFVAAAMLCPLPASAADLMRTSEVIEACDIVSGGDMFPRCMSYIQGIMDGFYRVDQSFNEETNSHDGFLGLCLPKNGVRGDTLVAALKTRVEFNPKDAGRPARTVIFGVLLEMYPCRDEAPKP